MEEHDGDILPIQLNIIVFETNIKTFGAVLFSFVTDLGSAVAMMSGVGSIQGVVRFLQLSEERCLIDGTIDGLEPGPHGLHVHTLGDLTLDCLR